MVRQLRIAHFSKAIWQENPHDLGWDRLTNGELLDAAEANGFDLLLTTDKNIRYQQNLTEQNCHPVLGNAQWPVLRLHVERLVAAVNSVTPSSYIELDIPDR
jgi:hypothetical protein